MSPRMATGEPSKDSILWSELSMHSSLTEAVTTFALEKVNFNDSLGRGCSGGGDVIRRTFFNVLQIFQSRLYSVLLFHSDIWIAAQALRLSLFPGCGLEEAKELKELKGWFHLCGNSVHSFQTLSQLSPVTILTCKRKKLGQTEGGQRNGEAQRERGRVFAQIQGGVRHCGVVWTQTGRTLPYSMLWAMSRELLGFGEQE